MILNNKGETIVEVLISIAVLAAVIGACYAIANTATIQSQQAHERIEGTKIAETQLEKLKYIAAHEPQIFALLQVPTTPLNMCIGSGASYQVIPVGTGTCSSGIYSYSFESYTPSSRQFKIVVKWDAFHGSGQDKVEMLYRVGN